MLFTNCTNNRKGLLIGSKPAVQSFFKIRYCLKSANKTYFNIVDTIQISFIYEMNNFGPNIDLQGISQTISLILP